MHRTDRKAEGEGSNFCALDVCDQITQKFFWGTQLVCSLSLLVLVSQAPSVCDTHSMPQDLP